MLCCRIQPERDANGSVYGSIGIMSPHSHMFLTYRETDPVAAALNDAPLISSVRS